MTEGNSQANYKNLNPHKYIIMVRNPKINDRLTTILLKAMVKQQEIMLPRLNDNRLKTKRLHKNIK